MSNNELNNFIRLEGCDPQALVEISDQFTNLDLSLIPPAAVQSVAEPHLMLSDKADWHAVATALGNIYQALCNNECNAALNAMHAIERLLAKRNISVQQPAITSRSQQAAEELPIETEFNYDE